jgi:hypothetical protein
MADPPMLDMLNAEISAAEQHEPCRGFQDINSE